MVFEYTKEKFLLAFLEKIITNDTGVLCVMIFILLKWNSSSFPKRSLLTASHASHNNLFCVTIQVFTGKIGSAIDSRVLFVNLNRSKFFWYSSNY